MFSSTTPVLLFALLVLGHVHADFFTSMADLQRLLQVEKDMPRVIDQYIAAENARLDELREQVLLSTDIIDQPSTFSIIKSFKSKNSDINKDLASVSNPINAFRMIKRLAETWRSLQGKMRADKTDDFIHNISYAGRPHFPEEEDLNGAAVGLLRLQDTYRLDTKDLANGIVGKLKTSREMTAHDCFEIGRLSYLNEDYFHTLMWMEEAMERANAESQPTASEEDILEYLAFALYKQGNVKRALIATDRLYELQPTHPRARGNIKFYTDELLRDGIRSADLRRHIPVKTNARPADAIENKERNMYEALCRQEVPISPKMTSNLYCYLKRDRPYLRLAPFKVEIVRFNPLAVMFRDVMSDVEIEQIQALATPKLARATVQNSVTGQLETASYRISKSAWLKENEGEVVARINARIELMTNLDQDTAEELQIANYGIGGHYDAHYDFARKEETKAFSDLGNKWIHVAGQEFRRPCGLKPSTYERYVGDLGAPEPRWHPNLRSA